MLLDKTPGHGFTTYAVILGPGIFRQTRGTKNHVDNRQLHSKVEFNRFLVT